MTPPADPARYKNHRFPGEIISHGVWLYYRFPLSYRDVQELLFERGIDITHEAIRQWCRKFGQDYANQLKRRRAQSPERTTLEQTIELRIDLRRAQYPFASIEQMLTNLRAAETLAEGLADHRRLGDLWVRAAAIFLRMQDYEPALAYCQRAHALATAVGDSDVQIEANVQMSKLYEALGDYRRTMLGYQECLTALQGERLYQSLGYLLLPSIETLSHMVRCLEAMGGFAKGVADGHEALQIAEAVDRLWERVVVYDSVGGLHVRQGSLHRAIPLLERAVALSQDANFTVQDRLSAPYLALAYALAGRVADTLAVLEQVGGNIGVLPALLICGEAYLYTGYVEEAYRLAQRALTGACEHKTRGHEARALWLLGEIALRRDPPDVALAEAHYQQALALAEELGMRPLQAHCHRGLGTLSVKTGQREQARSELSAAIDLYRAMDMTFWLPQAEAALAQAEGR
jgi:tetratricopeptide (TPR) repeat protein